MVRLRTATAVALLTAATTVTARPAAAADMPSYYAPPASDAAPSGPVEFGSGWYLRGDAAFGPEDKPKLLLGSVGGTPSFDRRGTATGYAFGGGAGYQFNEWFRADVTGDYLDPFRYAAVIPCGATCAIDQRAEVQRFDGLVNGYVDLGTFAGFTPYVGAGVGVAGTVESGSIRINGAPLASGIVDPRTGTLVTSGVPSRSDFRFAWAAMAGVSYAIAPHALLDIGYRYLDFGRTSVSLFPSATITRDLATQEVRFGIRYMVD